MDHRWKCTTERVSTVVRHSVVVKMTPLCHLFTYPMDYCLISHTFLSTKVEYNFDYIFRLVRLIESPLR